MRLPLPKALNPAQSDDDTRGLVSVDPTVSASATDESATVLDLNGGTHRVPAGWQVAEARLGEIAVAFLHRDGAVRVLTGDRSGRIREAKGYGTGILAEIASSRFGGARKASPESTEVDRLVALSDIPGQAPASETSTPDIDRLAAVGNSLDNSTSDDAEVARLVKLADAL
ncbi:hypothetical protein [Microbacterium proteolyticum]|uniref:hypothetical protein n=1 Tax=Microbacterium proteolyticum TaxID=1572644 RepID=UPI001FAE3942|nr:hypothetical protein [Microbacterium proteolyticum]MCI9856776.1 hypothetical protein [Microbacterium proteolyticum]